MPSNPTTQEMGERHEVYLAEINGGTKSRSSGNQWDDPGDGRNNHDEPFAFCWDGKSTKGKQNVITLAMIEKIREQALGEYPQIGLRWYANEVLDEVAEDWIAVPGEQWGEIIRAARKLVELESEHGDLAGAIAHLEHARDTEARAALGMAEELREAQRQLADERSMRGTKITLEGEPVLSDPRLAVPGYVPSLPWKIISVTHVDGRTVSTGIEYDALGHQRLFKPGQVRVERSANNRPRLFEGDVKIPCGDLYVDGIIRARVHADRPDLEVG